MDTQNQTPAAGSGLLSGPCREKYWEELDDAGKIQRLRQVVKDLQSQLARTTKTANDAECVSQDHEHGKDGKVLMPVGAFNRAKDECATRRRDEKWF